MKKEFIYCLIIVLVLSSTSTITYAAEPCIELTSSTDLSRLSPGDTFVLDVRATNIQDLVGGHIALSYDENLLQIIDKSLSIPSATNFSTLSGITNPNLQDSTNCILFVFGLDNGVLPLSGNHLMGQVTFKVLNKGTGVLSINPDSKLIYEDLQKNYGEIVFTPYSLSYTILGSGSLSGSLKDQLGNPVGGAVLEITKDNETLYTITSSPEGHFSLSNVLEGDYTVSISNNGYETYLQEIQITENIITSLDITLTKIVQGDINKDGVVDLADLVFVANYYGLDSNSPDWQAETSRADFNRDGKIDILDLIYVNRNLGNN